MKFKVNVLDGLTITVLLPFGYHLQGPVGPEMGTLKLAS